MTANAMVAVALMLMLLGAVGGWCAGWAGRGEENRRFHAGRERYAEQQAQRAQRELVATPAAAQPPVVMHVHMPTFPQGEAWPRVIDAPVDLDALPAGDGTAR